ncbi:MAG TPA: type II toxin-antitoxin system RelE/ParE family toxin [Flavobacteriales bacterium]|nr:type II toxin-antitoxin system RelE/ParE family toxin [Flavobacteriales bacterium]
MNWTSDSIGDIDGIATFIARDSPKSAALLVDRFLECEPLLKQNPRRGKPVREVGNDRIRELIMSSYRVIYLLVNEERIDILAVHHQKRQLHRRFLVRRAGRG